MPKPRVLIFIVSYNAEAFIEKVLERIPQSVWEHPKFNTEVLVIDDQSPDNTFYKALNWSQQHQHFNITVLHNPVNQGYGGNQKIGYHFAVQNDFDVVVLLHGDGQYPPEYVEEMVLPILHDEADVVLGSRMLNKINALKGHMPLYKWIGNQVLTTLQNWILGTQLAEFHTGYRAYRVASLARIPFQYNSDYFDFDTDIIIQILDTGNRIQEIAIPTFYGDEISHVNGFRYGILILLTTIFSRFVPLNIFYNPKFDYGLSEDVDALKLGFPSSHEFALSHVQAGDTVLDLASGPGYMAQKLAQLGVESIALDRTITPRTQKYATRAIEADLETFDFSEETSTPDHIFLLDILGHIRTPEDVLKKVRERYSHHAPNVIITTGNVAFFTLRIGLLWGLFNYSRRGILDLNHTRLFTFYSLKRLLRITGYVVLKEQGIPAPYPRALQDTRWSRLLLALNRMLIRISKSLFAYQIAIVAQPKPTLDVLLQNAQRSSQEKTEEQA